VSSNCSIGGSSEAPSQLAAPCCQPDLGSALEKRQRARAAGNETGWRLEEALIAAWQAWEAEARAMMEAEGEAPMYWRGAPGLARTVPPASGESTIEDQEDRCIVV
jgi:hypothetical protein